MLRFIAVLALVLVLALPAAAEEPTFTLGPDVLTFPQIARLMSRQGRTVVCAPALQNRAAFVYLKGRSWDATRSLLAAGLDVQLRPRVDAPMTWILERVPAVAARQRRWLLLMLSEMRRKLEARVAGYDPFWQIGYARLEAQFIPLIEEARALAKGPTTFPFVPTARQREVSAALQALDPILPGRPTAWIAARLLKNGLLTELEQAFYQTAPVHVMPLAEALADVSLDSMQHYGGGQIDASYTTCVYGLQLDPVAFSIRPTLWFCKPQDAIVYWGFLGAEAPRDVQQMFAGQGGPDPAEWAGIDPAAMKGLREERHATEAFLASPAGKQLIPINGLSHTSAFSQILQRWSAKRDAETLMELYPARDAVAAGSVNSPSPRPRPGQRLSSGIVFDALDALLDDSTVPLEAERWHEWTLREAQGVLLVTNRLAFVNRAFDFPLAAFLTLEKAAHPVYDRAHPGSGSLKGLTLADLTAYGKTSSPAQNQLWNVSSLLNYYRDISVEELVGMLPMTFLWDKVPPSDRARLLAQGTPKQPAFLRSANCRRRPSTRS